MEIPAFANIKAAQKEQRQRIWDNFAHETPKEGGAELITKALIDEQYPESEWERYSLPSLNKFREELTKAEGVSDPNVAFVEATKDLKHLLLADGGKQVPVFVRKKVKGE